MKERKNYIIDIGIKGHLHNCPPRGNSVFDQTWITQIALLNEREKVLNSMMTMLEDVALSLIDHDAGTCIDIHYSDRGRGSVVPRKYCRKETREKALKDEH